MIIIFVLHMHNQRTNAAQGGRTPNAHSRTRTRTRTRTHSLVAKCVQEKGVVACSMKRKHPTGQRPAGDSAVGATHGHDHTAMSRGQTRVLCQAYAHVRRHVSTCTRTRARTPTVVRESTLSFTQRFLDSLHSLVSRGENKNIFCFQVCLACKLTKPPSVASAFSRSFSPPTLSTQPRVACGPVSSLVHHWRGA
jgi:hypothetical protein